jgi:ATP-dependent DNA helicase RecQ
MPPIAFIDTEIDPKSRKILDIGAVKDDGSLFHQPSVGDFTRFVHGVEFVCGHNILNHDIRYIGKILVEAGVKAVVDTLFLSPLLFPTKPYHALLKDAKLQQIFYLLLHDQREFRSFFRYINYSYTGTNTEYIVRQLFENEICEHADLSKLIAEKPVELAYCL